MRCSRHPPSIAGWILGAFLAAILCVPLAAADLPFDHFEPDAVGHSWSNAYLLATASAWAYRVDVEQFEGEAWIDRFRFVYDRLGLEVLAYLDSGAGAEADTQALVLGGDSIIVVAFSGTATHDRKALLRDVKTDARIRQLELDVPGTGPVRIHRGFDAALGAVWEELEATLDTARRPAPRREGRPDAARPDAARPDAARPDAARPDAARPDAARPDAARPDAARALWLTGHSLGGALANLAAWRWHRQGVPVAGVVTFAAPKAGDIDFVADFEERLGARSQQWSTALDPITRLPETTKGEAYAKVGVTHVVHASGVAELDTVQKMTSAPNPLAHRTLAYVNYLYRALPEEVRVRVPPPPPLCAASSKRVGLHPQDGLPMCLTYGARKIRPAACRERDGTIFESWCLTEDAGKFRYRARKLKGGKE